MIKYLSCRMLMIKMTLKRTGKMFKIALTIKAFKILNSRLMIASCNNMKILKTQKLQISNLTITLATLIFLMKK
jgi:hypothetical protein